jgi:hypothetical protein
MAVLAVTAAVGATVDKAARSQETVVTVEPAALRALGGMEGMAVMATTRRGSSAATAGPAETGGLAVMVVQPLESAGVATAGRQLPEAQVGMAEVVATPLRKQVVPRAVTAAPVEMAL